LGCKGQLPTAFKAWWHHLLQRTENLHFETEVYTPSPAFRHGYVPRPYPKSENARLTECPPPKNNFYYFFSVFYTLQKYCEGAVSSSLRLDTSCGLPRRPFRVVEQF
jgi:hypothetical protein